MALVKFTRRQPGTIPGFAGTNLYPTFEDVENRMSRFFENAFNDPFGNALVPQIVGWVPATDIVESNDELLITAELPGMELKDIDVSFEEGVLTIRGEKMEEHKETIGDKKPNGDQKTNGDKKTLLYERTFGSFQRSFALPATVDGSKASAEFAKGVLKVKMPKTAEVKTKGRKIEVKAL